MSVWTGLVRWRPSSRAAVLLVCLVLVSQAVAAADAGLRRPILFASLLLLDVIGAACSFRAQRHSPYPWAWRLVALARTSAVASFFSLLWFVQTGDEVPYWVGIGLRSLMFALLAAAAFASRLAEIRGLSRWSFLAEIVVIVSAGAMLAWYLVLGPAFRDGRWFDLTRIFAYVMGDLLLLTAVCALVLGGAVPFLTHPTTPMAIGLTLILITDIVWNGFDVHGADPTTNWLLAAVMVTGSLLMTLSPLLAVAQGRKRIRLIRRPPWSQRLVLPALLIGATTMTAVAIRDHHMYPWGGLVVCLFLMVAAVMVHMTVSLRSTQALVVTDPLTGLANRAGLEAAIAAAVRRGDRVALLLIDLDDFKLINDAYGHAAGDTVLTEFGHHLRASVRTHDTCARIGGDEFAVLLLDGNAPETVARRILAAVATHPVRLGNETVTVHASIGLTDSQPGDIGKDLLRRADLAMYTAKRTGAHTWARHDPSMVDRRALDAALADQLAGAADRGELRVFYQPIVDIETGTPTGFEALVRWQHPTRGMVAPLDFIPVAERTGLIHDIGLYVLERACRDTATAPGQPYLSVNLSPQQLQRATLVHDLLAVLRRTGTAAQRLVLEVTESAIVDEHSIATLHVLRTHGIRIAVDDFGTGYSSLQYLTRLPVDILKIDRSFVAQLDNAEVGSAIAEAIIRLAQVLRLRTIAEGIETGQQAAELLTLGCHTGQGYLYAPPRPAEEAFRALGYSAGTVAPS